MHLFTPKQLKATEQANLKVLKEQEARAAQSLAGKIKLNSELDEAHRQKMAERTKELGEIELRIRTVLAKEHTEITSLEERRRQALAPIIEEQNALKVTQEQIQKQFEAIGNERREIQQMRELLSLRSNTLEATMRSFEKTQGEVLANIERRRCDAEEVIAAAEVASKRIQHEDIRITARQEELARQEENVKSAERIARAAIAKADAQIYKLEKEKQEVIEQRKTLALAIKAAKKRGLWQTQ